MQHKHFETIDSTQVYLHDHVKAHSEVQNFLVTTDHQANGHGRRGSNWIHFENATACSFTFNPSEPISLSSLELGVIVSEYIKKKFKADLKLKWPNDLYNNLNKKVGGIICQQVGNIVVVGLGLNLGTLNHDEYGSITDEEYKKSELIEISKEIYFYLLKNRIQSSNIVSKWESNCLHLKKMVSIENQKGIFLGIGKNGEALLNVNGVTKSFYSGSLILLQDPL